MHEGIKYKCPQCYYQVLSVRKYAVVQLRMGRRYWMKSTSYSLAWIIHSAVTGTRLVIIGVWILTWVHSTVLHIHMAPLMQAPQQWVEWL